MKMLMLAISVVLIMSVPAYAAEGMIDVKSSFGVEETGVRLANILEKKGMTIFNRVKHSDAAKKVNVELRKTELIIFGNPKVGSPLMKCQQSVAIDLPQKALIWEDSEGTVWISYNDPKYLVKRHGISNCGEVISKIEKALAGISKAAATQQGRQALELYLEGLGLRSIGRFLKCSHVTVYNWIKAFGEAAEEIRSESTIEVVEIDEMHTYISYEKTTAGSRLLLIDMEKKFVNCSIY